MKRRPQTAGLTLIEIVTVITTIFVLIGIATYIYSSYTSKVQDATAKGDLRQAYNAAMAFFIDNPSKFLTESGLKQYGFKSSPNSSVIIIDGSPSSLFLLSRHNALGTQAYVLYAEGINSPGASDQVWIDQWVPGGAANGGPATGFPPSSPTQGPEPGQTISSLQANLLEKCNIMAKAALAQAYNAAQSFFQSHPGDFLTKDLLISYGYTPNENVNLTIIDGSPDKFSMSAVFNIPGATNFGIDSSGSIVPHT
jgi:Tfp pilus assembly protein PilE